MPVNFDALTAVQAAAMFDVSEKTVRNWMNDNGLPFAGSGRGRTVKASDAIRWHEEYTRKQGGNGGKFAPVAATSGVPEPLESYEDALSRKTRAEADLKELQLARERGQVASIADVEKVLAASTLATQTQILAVPSRLSTRMLGIQDHGQAVAILDSEMRQLLTNLATIDAVKEAATAAGEDE